MHQAAKAVCRLNMIWLIMSVRTSFNDLRDSGSEKLITDGREALGTDPKVVIRSEREAHNNTFSTLR